MVLKIFTEPQAQQIIFIIIFFWLVFLSFYLVKTIYHYRYLISKVKKGDLKAILEAILNKVDKQGNQIDSLSSQVNMIIKNSQKHLQKVGFLRFNPFADTGGDQSFSLSLLDGEDGGIVISSLHSRGQTRVYAKAVKKGKGKDLTLSKEETEVINIAKKGR